MAWYDSTRLRTAAREYKSREAFQKDANKAAARGWTVVSSSEMSQRTGCLRGCTLGFFSLIFRPRSHILVTYSRSTS